MPLNALPLDVPKPCTAASPDIFFPKDYISEWHTTVKQAKDICSRCSIISECLQYALSQGRSLDGIWGGTTPGQRQEMLRGSFGRKITVPKT
jgi:WhiB family redox-sensing transcriptional regulator